MDRIFDFWYFGQIFDLETFDLKFKRISGQCDIHRVYEDINDKKQI